MVRIKLLVKDVSLVPKRYFAFSDLLPLLDQSLREFWEVFLRQIAKFDLFSSNLDSHLAASLIEYAFIAEASAFWNLCHFFVVIQVLFF